MAVLSAWASRTGAVDGEIDGAGDSAEYIRFESISGSRLLSAFTVSFLYAAPAFGDTVNESASIIIDGVTYVLSVIDTLNASFFFRPWRDSDKFVSGFRMQVAVHGR